MRSFGGLVGVGMVSVVVLVYACGPKPETHVAPLPSASASASAVSSSSAPPAAASGVNLGTMKIPTDVPPPVALPASGVVGSKKARRRDTAELRACVPSKLQTKDPIAELGKVAAACEKAAKLKPIGAPTRGTQKDDGGHAEHKVKVESGRCYRVYIAHDAATVVIGMRDSAGNLVAESAVLALPEGGLACFQSADEVVVTVAAGSGKADYAFQVYSD